ncbi:hypothetical protein [Hallella colorans]|uniref:hypothetical protein n=1 Tax=Hallella colorans TaxID=1703337 RepID=UPI0023F003EC|nr:hypothetical protein [Hallella colorans]
MMENKDKNNNQGYWKDAEAETDWQPSWQADGSPRQEDATIRVPYAPLDEQKKADKEDTAKPFMGYDKQIATLNELANRYRPETDDERKRREKRERSSKIIAGVTDGIRALSNLYFTTKYSPNAYDHRRDSATTPLQEKLEALRRERKMEGDRYYNYVMQAGALENERGRMQQAEKERQQRMNIANEEHQWRKDIQPEIQRKAVGEADAAGYRAQAEGVKSYYAPLQQQADLNLKGERVKTERGKQNVQHSQVSLNRTRANESRARAGAAGRSNAKEYRAWDRNGRERWFSDEKSALSFARQEGTAGKVSVSTTTTSDKTDPITGKKVSDSKTATKHVAYPAKPIPKPKPHQKQGKKPIYQNTKKLGL